MSNILKAEDTASSRTGAMLIKGSVVGGGMVVGAALIPFVTLPMLLIAMFVAGVVLY